jgi:hypothetical protein
MSSEQKLLKRLYERFDARDIESVIAALRYPRKLIFFTEDNEGNEGLNGVWLDQGRS